MKHHHRVGIGLHHPLHQIVLRVKEVRQSTLETRPKLVVQCTLSPLRERSRRSEPSPEFVPTNTSATSALLARTIAFAISELLAYSTSICRKPRRSR